MKIRIDRFDVGKATGWQGLVENDYGQLLRATQIYWEDTDGDQAYQYAKAGAEELLAELWNRR